jgi:hypothetical protein
MSHSPKHFDEITSLFSASCPFGKLSVRQNIRSAKRPSAKRPFGKMSVRQNVFRQNVFRQSVFRQNVRVPSLLTRSFCRSSCEKCNYWPFGRNRTRAWPCDDNWTCSSVVAQLVRLGNSYIQLIQKRLSFGNRKL